MLPGSENHVKFDLSLEPLSKDSYFAKATNQTHSQTGFSLILTRSQGCISIDIFPSEPCTKTHSKKVLVVGSQKVLY